MVSPEGYEMATLLAGSGIAEIGLTAEGDAIATGEQAIPLP